MTPLTVNELQVLSLISNSYSDSVKGKFMSLDQYIQRVPKTILVGGVLILALAFFVLNEPLRDECEVEARNFDKNTRGVLSAGKKKGKIQFAQMMYWKDRCREGNSAGACEDYFNGLRMVTSEFKSFSNQCQTKYVEKNEDFLPHIAHALKIIPLLAWGEKPPADISFRQGWLTEADVKTFCALKNIYLTTAGDEKFLELRSSVYGVYPDAWPENAPIDGRDVESRPKALKTIENTQGSLTKEKIYERSLFSMRCDLYM